MKLYWEQRDGASVLLGCLAQHPASLGAAPYEPHSLHSASSRDVLCPMSLGWCPCPHLRIRCCILRVWGKTAVSFWAAYLSSELPGCWDSPSARGCSSHVCSQTPPGRCEPMGICKSVQVLKWRRRRVKKKKHTPPMRALWLKSPCTHPPGGSARVHLLSANGCR